MTHIRVLLSLSITNDHFNTAVETLLRARAEIPAVTSIPMSIGDRIDAVMRAKGLKQNWVAEGAGITPATLNNIIHGKTQDPAVSVVAAIAHVIGETVSSLLDEGSSTLLAHEQKTLSTAVEIITTRVLPHEDRSIVAPSRFQRRRKAKSHAVPAPSVAASPNRQIFTDVRELPKREIPRELRERGVTRVFRVDGDSMIDAGINDGDTLYVKSGVTPSGVNGRIVVCRVGEFDCVKRLVIKGGRISLESENTKFPPVTISDEEARNDFELYGIVIAHLSEV